MARDRGGRNWVSSLLLGQSISLLITGTGVFETWLVNSGVDIPAVQAFANYLLLCVHLPWARWWRQATSAGESSDVASIHRNAGPGAQRPSLWHYAAWAIADVEANYLVVWAYQYTSVVSVMLLDCFAIPCAMMLSAAFMGARYGKWHVVACLICITGLAFTVLSDAMSSEAQPAPQGPAWLGDLMVLTSAALYSVSNVQQERIMKLSGSVGRSEALGYLGFWGSLIAGVQAALSERSALEQCVWTPWTALLLVGYQLCLYCMYVLTSRFLLASDATLFNLSMLTSDVYSVIFAWKVQQQRFSLLYAAAFTTTMSGVAIYSAQPVPVVDSEVAAESARIALLAETLLQKGVRPKNLLALVREHASLQADGPYLPVDARGAETVRA